MASDQQLSEEANPGLLLRVRPTTLRRFDSAFRISLFLYLKRVSKSLYVSGRGGSFLATCPSTLIYCQRIPDIVLIFSIIIAASNTCLTNPQMADAPIVLAPDRAWVDAPAANQSVHLMPSAPNSLMTSEFYRSV